MRAAAGSGGLAAAAQMQHWQGNAKMIFFFQK